MKYVIDAVTKIKENAASNRLCFEVRSSKIFSFVKVFSVVLEAITIVIVPAAIRVKAGRSYSHLNLSPRHLTERKVFQARAIIEVDDNRTKSKNGNATS